MDSWDFLKVFFINKIISGITNSTHNCNILKSYLHVWTQHDTVTNILFEHFIERRLNSWFLSNLQTVKYDFFSQILHIYRFHSKEQNVRKKNRGKTNLIRAYSGSVQFLLTMIAHFDFDYCLCIAWDIFVLIDKDEYLVISFNCR